MTAARKPVAVAEKPKHAPRGRGRPPRNDSPIGTEPTLSRAAILQHAIELTKTVPLDQISMVQLAKDFGVAPGLIHYYLGGRDKLVSGVLNAYYRMRMARAENLTGDWRRDVERIARNSFEVAIENPGVSLYVASHNRYRLFQDVEPGETDYGMEFFNLMTSAIMQGGFTADQVALAYHLIAQYLVSTSMAETSRQLPAYHQAFIEEKLGQAPAAQYPGARFVSKAFSHLSSETSFEEGLRITLDGIDAWRQARKGKAKAG
ncbi:TetR/AcrR family transcriptional regulator [Burkholderia guangdongensis]|uniref:TetR/AcrR family transcriptional regulator n=1 Tax=Burkholderia guangdongensis TaxID=1792500 RepID=UPI0015CCD512|nr:TetR/AcrR family transcriptional regulator C-terminal domain-containing protein [Burkholderia guangdongensis]